LLRDYEYAHKEDLFEALQQCNFNKGLGPDGFDGSVLKWDPEVADILFESILSWSASG
jgi:hypothetical protein